MTSCKDTQLASSFLMLIYYKTFSLFFIKKNEFITESEFKCIFFVVFFFYSKLVLGTLTCKCSSASSNKWYF